MTSHYTGANPSPTSQRSLESSEREQRILAEALRDSASAINSTLKLEEVLDRILDNIHRVVEANMANVMLVRDGMAYNTRRRGYYAEPGLDEQMAELVFAVADTPTLRYMSQTRQFKLIPDVRFDPDWANPFDSNIRAYLGAPIVINDEVIGFLSLDSFRPGAFTETDGERLKAFADQAAIAINNARLYDELAMRSRELEAFSHIVAHDLKAPLNNLISAAYLLEQDLNLTGDDAKLIQHMVTSAFKMNQIIESLLLLATLHSPESSIICVEVRPIIEAAAERFASELARGGIALHIQPDLPDAWGSGPWLEEVFANLISNAIKYIGSNNPDPVIEITGQEAGDVTRFAVRDNGVGIETENQQRVFEMFSRFHRGEASGLGLGLSIVDRIVSKLGGRVGVESAPGQGTSFWFTLPIRKQAGV